MAVNPLADDTEDVAWLTKVTLRLTSLLISLGGRFLPQNMPMIRALFARGTLTATESTSSQLPVLNVR